MSSEQRLLNPAFVRVSAANFLQGVAFSLFLHFPGFLKVLGAGELEIGWIYAAMHAVAIAGRPWVGRLMDTRGRRPVILGASALAVVAVALLPGAGDLGARVVALRIAVGLAEAALYTALFTYAADHVPPRRRTQGLGLFGASGLLSVSAGGALGDLVLAHAGFDALFAVAALFATGGILAVLPLRDAEPTATGGPRRGLGAALRQPDLVPLWWMGFVFFAALSALFTFFKTYVMETGAGSVGAFFTAYTGAALLLRIGFGWIPDRVGPRRALAPSLAALAVGFALLAAADGWVEVLVAGVCCGAGHGYAFPILFGLVVTRARASERGSASAIYTALDDGGAMLGGPAFGLLIERASYAATFGTAAALIAVGGLVFFAADRRWRSA